MCERQGQRLGRSGELPRQRRRDARGCSTTRSSTRPGTTATSCAWCLSSTSGIRISRRPSARRSHSSAIPTQPGALRSRARTPPAARARPRSGRRSRRECRRRRRVSARPVATASRAASRRRRVRRERCARPAPRGRRVGALERDVQAPASARRREPSPRARHVAQPRGSGAGAWRPRREGARQALGSTP